MYTRAHHILLRIILILSHLLQEGFSYGNEGETKEGELSLFCNQLFFSELDGKLFMENLSLSLTTSTLNFRLKSKYLEGNYSRGFVPTILLFKEGSLSFCKEGNELWKIDYTKLWLTQKGVTIKDGYITLFNRVKIPLLRIPWIKFYITPHVGLLFPYIYYSGRSKNLMFIQPIYFPFDSFNIETSLALSHKLEYLGIINEIYNSGFSFKFFYFVKPKFVSQLEGHDFGVEGNSFITTDTTSLLLDFNYISSLSFYRYLLTPSPTTITKTEFISKGVIGYIKRRELRFTVSFYYWQELLGDTPPYIFSPEFSLLMGPLKLIDNIYVKGGGRIFLVFKPNKEVLDYILDENLDFVYYSIFKGIFLNFIVRNNFNHFFNSQASIYVLNINNTIKYPLTRKYKFTTHTVIPEFSFNINFPTFLTNSLKDQFKELFQFIFEEYRLVKFRLTQEINIYKSPFVQLTVDLGSFLLEQRGDVTPSFVINTALNTRFMELSLKLKSNLEALWNINEVKVGFLISDHLKNSMRIEYVKLIQSLVLLEATPILFYNQIQGNFLVIGYRYKGEKLDIEPNIYFFWDVPSSIIVEAVSLNILYRSPSNCLTIGGSIYYWNNGFPSFTVVLKPF